MDTVSPGSEKCQGRFQSQVPSVLWNFQQCVVVCVCACKPETNEARAAKGIDSGQDLCVWGGGILSLLLYPSPPILIITFSDLLQMQNVLWFPFWL